MQVVFLKMFKNQISHFKFSAFLYNHSISYIFLKENWFNSLPPICWPVWFSHVSCKKWTTGISFLLPKLKINPKQRGGKSPAEPIRNCGHLSQKGGSRITTKALFLLWRHIRIGIKPSRKGLRSALGSDSPGIHLSLPCCRLFYIFWRCGVE